MNLLNLNIIRKEEAGLRKFKDDNRGITLVELIVSIAILALIVLPFLNAFVTATKTNVKARNKMNATHLATNIMEGIENNSMKTMAYQFNYPSEGFDLADGFDMADGSNAKELYYKNGKYTDVKRFEDVMNAHPEAENLDKWMTSSIHKKNNTAFLGDTSSWKFVENKEHKYYFWMTDVKSGTKKYNAMVTVDGKGEANSKVEQYNTIDKVADMSAMDSNYDCMSSDVATIEELMNTLKNRGYSDIESNKDSISRTITLDITGGSSTKVTVSYSYKFTSGGHMHVFPEDAAMKQIYTSVIFDNTSNTANRTLKNIYLFYKPWYTSTANSDWNSCKDTIIINNNDKIDCTVNIVKQNYDDKSSDDEDKYRMYVRVNEKGNNTGNAHVSICTNLDTNMKDPDSKSKTQPQQAKYMFNSNNTQSTVKKSIKIDDLTKSKTVERLYNVTVDIYDSKTCSTPDKLAGAKKAATMTGSMRY